MTNKILTQLLKHFATYPELVRLISDIIDDDTLWQNHHLFKLEVINLKLHEDTIFVAYAQIYDDYMYYLNCGTKFWYKLGTKKLHRLVKPAKISPESSEWWIDGERNRPERDEYGNRLPTEIRNNLQIWNVRHTQDRMELGKNPNSEDFGKALPALIFNDGTKIWKFDDEVYPQELLTKMLESEDFCYVNDHPIWGSLYY
jgi:hypothetical protein